MFWHILVVSPPIYKLFGEFMLWCIEYSPIEKYQDLGFVVFFN